MSHFSRGSLCALGGAGGLVVVLFLSRGDTSEGSRAAQARKGAELDARLEQARVRRLALTHEIRKLIDGRLTLPQAAARVRATDRSRRMFLVREFRAQYPGKTDDERFCHKAICHAESLLINEPKRSRAVRRRLEAELRAILRRGPLRLPALAE